jgi:hypothetical protein
MQARFVTHLAPPQKFPSLFPFSAPTAGSGLRRRFPHSPHADKNKEIPCRTRDLFAFFLAVF